LAFRFVVAFITYITIHFFLDFNMPSDSTTPEQAKQEDADEAALLLLSTTHNISTIEETLLEQTVDSCVTCMDNISTQDVLESSLEPLSPTEGSQIRLAAMEQQNSTTNSLSLNLNDLNLCGTEDLDDVTTSLFHLNKTQTRPLSPPSLHCAICFDDVTSFQKTATTFCLLPCCGSEGREARSSTKICTACMLLLSQPVSDKRIGRCPRCREWLVIQQDGLDISVLKSAGMCQVCNQVKEVLLEDDNVCDACFLGRTHPLYYECQSCRQFQCIPHPMYRYQATPQDYGTTSWACQGPCQHFTKWRIVPEYINQIPAGDVPESWNHDHLELARIQVMEIRRRQEQNGDSNSSACVIQ
jgi:hypothetical protein